MHPSLYVTPLIHRSTFPLWSFHLCIALPLHHLSCFLMLKGLFVVCCTALDSTPQLPLCAWIIFIIGSFIFYTNGWLISDSSSFSSSSRFAEIFTASSMTSRSCSKSVASVRRRTTCSWVWELLLAICLFSWCCQLTTALLGMPWLTLRCFAPFELLNLGDFVDRGHHSVETFLLLLALKVRWTTCAYSWTGRQEPLGSLGASAEWHGVDISINDSLYCMFFLRDNRSDTQTGLPLFAATTNQDRLQRSMDSTTSASRSLVPPMSGDTAVRSSTTWACLPLSTIVSFVCTEDSHRPSTLSTRYAFHSLHLGSAVSLLKVGGGGREEIMSYLHCEMNLLGLLDPDYW